MQTCNQIPELRLISAASAVIVLLLGAATPSRAHIIPVADLVRGIAMTQAQCAALPQTVWLGVVGHEFCVRYYLSAVGGGTRPVVFLQGDRLGRLNLKTGEYALTARDKDIDTNTFGGSPMGCRSRPKVRRCIWRVPASTARPATIGSVTACWI